MDTALALSTNMFSVEEPTLGYLYQITYSLLLLIQSSEIEDAKVAIKKLDDIVLLEPDSAHVFQMKYHLNSVANLTDRSSDLWKTMRVWCTAIADGNIDPTSTSLHLITTAPASDNTIARECTKDAVDREPLNISAALFPVKFAMVKYGIFHRSGQRKGQPHSRLMSVRTAGMISAMSVRQA